MSDATATPFPRRRFWRGTTVGTLGSPVRVGVGLDGWSRVEPGWQLGWWVGAEDRWHLPEHEVAVRQRLVEEAPVVETAMRIPGGDARHRAFATAGGELGPLLVLEVENASAMPVAVALVVTGLDDRLTVEPGDGSATVGFRHIDPTGGEYRTEHRLLFDRAPAQVAQGRGVAVFVFPVAHTGTLRAVMPLEQSGAGPFPGAVPSAAAVAKGWEAQGGRGVRVELPDPTLAATLDACRRSLLLAELGAGELVGGVAPGPRGRATGLDWVEAAQLTAANDRVGFWPESERILLTLPDRLGDEGAVDAAGRVDTAGAALVALDHHVARTGNDALAAATVELVMAVAQGLRQRALPGRWRARGGPALAARPPGVAAGDVTWWAWWWVVAGFDAAARLFDRAGEEAAATQARRDAATARERVVALGGGPGPRAVGPDARLDATAWVNLVVGLHLPAADRAGWWPATRAWLAAEATDEQGRVMFGPNGMVRPWATLALAAAEVAVGDPAGLARLATVAADGGDLRAWPEQHQVPSGAAGQGRCPDPVVAAAFVSTVLDLLVQAPVDGGLVLAPVVPTTWYGQGWEVHDAPTPYGRFSYAVRWHGERPALLWQCEHRAGRPPVPLTIPGLDPTWSTTEARGEALLAPPGAAGQAGAGPRGGGHRLGGDGPADPADPGASFN